MHHFSRIILSCLLLISTAGCASLVSKSTYPVTITSNPESVNVRIVDRYDAIVFDGLTPVTLPLKAGSGYFKNAVYEVILSRQGYQTHSFLIESQIDGWYFGNIAIGGVLGMLVIDPLTGAMWKIETDAYNFTLAPDTDEASAKGLRIISLDEVPDHLHPALVPLKTTH